MGELYAFDFISNQPMALVLMDDREIERFSLRIGDLLFARQSLVLEGTGKCSIVASEPATVTTFESHLIRVRLDATKADPRFYFYFFGSPQGRAAIQSIVMQVAAAGIRASELATLEIPVPPLSIQQKIAAILSAYDDLIENNERRIKLLEEMAQRMYREWFVDFRYPGHEDVPLVDSELGPIPEGWKVEPFAVLGAYVNGYAFKPGDWGADGQPIVKIKELKTGVTDETPRYAGDLGEKYVVRDGDLLFSWSADLEAYLWTGGQAWLNQHLFRVDPAPGIPSAFLFHALRDRMAEFRRRAQGTTMRHIKRAALDQVATAVPLESQRTEMAGVVMPMDRLRLELVRASRNLRKTRDLLLPRLISGEADVADLDIAMPVAAT